VGAREGLREGERDGFLVVGCFDGVLDVGCFDGVLDGKYVGRHEGVKEIEGSAEGCMEG
jgi:hypothetical protein